MLQLFYLLEKPKRVERFPYGTQFLLLARGQRPREQRPLQRRFSRVVDPMDLSPLDLFGYQLHRWLKTVHVPMESTIQFVQLPIGMLANQAAMAHHLAHHHPIFLFHEALVPFLIGTSSREGDLLTHTIGSDLFVDKFSAVIGIESQDRKWEARPGALEGSQDGFSPPIEQGETFCPPGGDIGQRNGIQAATLQSPSTVSNQINLQEAWFGLVLLSVSADRNLLLEQGASFGRRKAMGMRVAVGLQETICGGCAHREELAAVFLAELDMPLLLQFFEHIRQERYQAFRTNPVEGLPSQHQRFFDFWPIATAKCCWWREDLLDVMKQPLGIFTCIPGGNDKFLQDLLFLES
nr:hypothetical protein [Ktedonobacter sp. SOSP1-52]